METKYKILIAVTATTIAFASGRYSAPVKVKEVVKTVEVVKIVKDKKTDTKKRQKTVRTVVTHPDGTKEERTEIVDDIERKTDETIDKDKTTAKTDEKEITRSSGVTAISVLGGWDFRTNRSVIGISASKSILGPISVGAWGLNNATFGASIGINF